MSLHTNVKRIKEEIKMHSDFNIFLFGSIITSDSPNDIDLLIIYNSRKITIKEILEYRVKLKLAYYETYNIILDITLLSLIENMEVNFLSRIEYIQI